MHRISLPTEEELRLRAANNNDPSQHALRLELDRMLREDPGTPDTFIFARHAFEAASS